MLGWDLLDYVVDTEGRLQVSELITYFGGVRDRVLVFSHGVRFVEDIDWDDTREEFERLWANAIKPSKQIMKIGPTSYIRGYRRRGLVETCL